MVVATSVNVIHALLKDIFKEKITSKDVTWPRADTARIGNITRFGSITGIENVTKFDSNLDWKVTGIMQYIMKCYEN